jgi:rhomboid protease GluP
MFNLFFIGQVLEPAIGKIKFISIYILAAIVSIIASIAFKNTIVTVGASGSLFAITGLFFSMLYFNIFEQYTKALYYASTLNFLIFNICIGLFTPTVDFTAHMAGFASGVLFFLCFKNKILQTL